jgi:hypothetical protein
MRFVASHFDRRANLRRFVFICSAVFMTMSGAVLQLNARTPTPQIMVVDIIPEILSGETNTNSEPNLAVNPADPSQIAAAAYLPEPMGGKTAVVFISGDGGNTWGCRSTVPIDDISCDFTLRFGGLLNTLYLAALHDPGHKHQPELVICATDRLAKRPMQPGATRRGKGVDQPYVAAVTINKKDRVFVGDNDWNGPSERTATIDRSLDGSGSSPGFTPIPIEFKNAAKDSSEIRPAISGDGRKVYAVFNRVINDYGCIRVADVILVRDDNGGDSGRASFTALRDQNNVPGLPVVKRRTFGWDILLGGDRLGGDLAIAVDPKKANRVYLAWGELIEGKPTLHVIRSNDSGATWSDVLRTVTNVKNPGLAMNANGTLGFLYQQVFTSESGEETWRTNLERTQNDFKHVDTKTLSRFPVSEVKTDNGQPQLGDYLHLMSVGDDFYGIFPASNVPDDSRFDCGVIFQRRVDRKAGKLLGLDGQEVDHSIDPFFFKVADQPRIDTGPQK